MIDLLCLLEFYNTYSHDDIYYEIAGKMIREFEQIREMSAHELADYLFISQSTLYRFIKMMYYNSHKEMKGCQQEFLEHYVRNSRYFPKNPTGESRIDDYADYLCRSVRRLAADMQEEILACVEKALIQAEHIVFAGIPMPSTVWRLQVELTLLGKRTSAFLNPIYQLEEIETAGKDVLIFMIHYTTDDGDFYQRVIDIARKRGSRTVILTNNPISSILGQADYPLCFEGDLVESDMILINMVLYKIGDRLFEEVMKNRRDQKKIKK